MTPRLRAILLLAAAAAGAWWAYHHWFGAPRQAAPGAMAVTVEGLAATSGHIAQTLTVSGQVEALHGAELRAEIAGRVVAVPAADGTPVKRGDVLIQLDDSVLKAQLAQAQANLQLSENTAARNKRLLAAGAVSPQESETAAAQAKLARANVQLAQANLDKAHIAAPFDGVAGVAQVNIGNYVSPGTLLTTVTEPARLKVLFRLPGQLARTIAVGSPVTVRSDTAEAPGQVAALDGMVDPATRTVQARVDIDNSQNLLVPGQFVRATVETESADNAVLVPDMALVQQGAQTFVYAVVPDPSATAPGAMVASKTTVTVGLRQNNMAQLAGGLNAGDLVVTSGQQKLQKPVMPVRLTTPTVVTVAPQPVENLDPSKAN